MWFRWPAALGLLFFGGCVQHSIELEPREATSVVKEYAERGTARVEYGTQTIVIERKHRPSLRIRDSMLFGEVHDAPLDDVKIEGDTLVFPSQTGPARVDPRHSYETRLVLGSYHPPDEELLFGVGVAVGAPTVYSAPFLDLGLSQEFALELGAFAVTRAVWGHAGFRVVPFKRGMMRPFLGGVVHGASYRDQDADEVPATDPMRDERPARRIAAVGPRLGSDWMLDSGHYAIRTEFNLLYSLYPRWLLGIESRIIPWAGVSAIAYQ